MSWAIRADLSAIHESGRDNSRRILGVLACHADQYTLVTNVGIETIAEKIQVTTRTVKRCLPKLEQAGLILVKRIRRFGNMYMLLLGDLDQSTLESVTEVFKKGRNLEQIIESLSDTLLSLRNGNKTDFLSDNLPPSKGQLGVTPTGYKEKNRVNHRGKHKNKSQSSKRNFDATSITLPLWLEPGIWGEYVTHRVELNKPLTKTSASRVIGKLGKLKQEGNDPAAVIEQTLENGWLGLFEIKRANSNGYRSQADRAADNIEQMLKRTASDSGINETGGTVPRLRVISDD